MRRLALLPLAVILIAWPARGDDPKADDKPIQGTWNLTEAELAGMKLPLKDLTLTLDNGKYEVKAPGELDKGTYTIDAAKKPKHVDVKGTEGPNQGKTYPGIYELDGDTLKICYDLSGKARPKEFKTAAGTQLFLATYKRKKS